MSNYSKTTDFAAKDSLPSGDSGKIIRGSEFETEFDNISTAIATKADAASPTFTGTVTIDGLTVDGNTTLGNAATDTVTVTADIASNLIPSADDTYNLGAVGAEWNDLHVDGVAYIDTINGFAATGDVNFGDNNKAQFGAGSDLQIYHDGSNSFIDDAGTGDLYLRGSGAVRIGGYASETAAIFNHNGSVELRYDNAQKLATTSTGINVTGTVTADGLTVDGNATISGASNGLRLTETDTTDLNSYITNQAGTLRIRSANDAYNSFTTRLQVDHATGDISFYEDTGTTAKFFWDASAESLGIGNSAPSTALDVNGTVTANELALSVKTAITGATPRVEFFESDTTDLNNRIRTTTGVFQIQTTDDLGTTSKTRLQIDNNDGEIAFYNAGGSAKKAVWDATNLRLGVGTVTPASTLDVAGTVTADGLIVDGSVSSIKYDVASSDPHTDPVLHLENQNATDNNVAALKLSADNSAGVAGSAYIYAQSETANQKGNLVFAREDGANNPVSSMKLSSNGDVIFYENTGTTPKLFWDASAERLGLGTDLPTQTLHAVSSGFTVGRFSSTSTVSRITFDNSTETNQSHTSIGADGSDLQFRTGNGERVRIDTAGRVGIGVSAPTESLDVDGRVLITQSGGSGGTPNPDCRELVIDGVGTTGISILAVDDPLIRFGNAADGSSAIVRYDTSTDVFECGSTKPAAEFALLSGNGVEAIRIDAGGRLIVPEGITLGTSTFTYAAAKTLDDYEEGTFVPVIADATSGGNTGTATTIEGRYTKIGRQVTLILKIEDIDTTGMTGTNNLFIRNLPFTAGSGATGQSQGSLRLDRIDLDVNCRGVVASTQSNSTHLNLRQTLDNAADIQVSVQDVTSGSADLFTTITYFV